MTRQTLHALSAAPRSKIIATDTWVQAKRKPESQRNNNRDHYQHWLIQVCLVLFYLYVTFLNFISQNFDLKF